MISTFIDKQIEQQLQVQDRYLKLQYSIMEEVPFEIYKEARRRIMNSDRAWIGYAAFRNALLNFLAQKVKLDPRYDKNYRI